MMTRTWVKVVVYTQFAQIFSHVMEKSVTFYLLTTYTSMFPARKPSPSQDRLVHDHIHGDGGGRSSSISPTTTVRCPTTVTSTGQCAMILITPPHGREAAS
jgi:hypothetical protein